MTSERKFIKENIKRVLLKEFLRRKTERSGFGGLDVQRTPMGTRVTLIAERPGMVIGRKGESIKELTDFVQNKFKFDNPQIEVKEVPNPNLNPHIMAQKLATALERGWHFRRAGHSTVRRIMSAGAKGCQIIISGKLTGQRHRTEKFREGHIKYCGETKLDWMHEGFAVAKKKLGVIGVKVQIMDPNAKLPDEIELRELKDVAEIKTIHEGAGTEELEVVDLAAETTIEGGAETEVSPAEVETGLALEAEDTAATTTTKKKKTKKEEKETEIAEDKKTKDKEKEPKKGRKTKKSQKKETEDKEKTAEVSVETVPEVPETPGDSNGDVELEPSSEPKPEIPEEPEPEKEPEPEIPEEPEPEKEPEPEIPEEPEPEKEAQKDGKKEDKDDEETDKVEN